MSVLFLELDAFGDDVEVEARAERDDRGLRATFSPAATNERSILRMSTGKRLR